MGHNGNDEMNRRVAEQVEELAVEARPDASSCRWRREIDRGLRGPALGWPGSERHRVGESEHLVVVAGDEKVIAHGGAVELRLPVGVLVTVLSPAPIRRILRLCLVGVDDLLELV